MACMKAAEMRQPGRQEGNPVTQKPREANVSRLKPNKQLSDSGSLALFPFLPWQSLPALPTNKHGEHLIHMQDRI